MALSMDEQRMLAEIERRLAAEDPGLAARMSTFRKPARVHIFRSARARIIGSLLTVAVVATVSLMVYAILPFRSGARTTGNHPVTVSSSGSGQAKIGAGPAANSAKDSAAAKPATGSTTSHSPSARPTGSAAHATSASSSAAGRPASTTASTAVHGP